MSTGVFGVTSPYGADIDAHVARFQAYVEQFRQGCRRDVAHIDLKREHSLRVLSNARLIADSLPLPPTVRRTCLLGALYHDVGRFPQYRTHRTFHDGRSVNHGLLGAQTLRREGLVLDLEPAARAAVQAVVAMHNRRVVPVGISPGLRLAVDITRDADKLDIFVIMIDHFSPERHADPVVTLHLKDHPEAYSRTIYDQILARKQVSYGEMEWVNDFKLLLCSWSYCLRFSASRELFRQRGCLEALFGLLPSNEEMRVLQEELKRAPSDLDATTQPKTGYAFRQEGGSSFGGKG